MAIRIPNLFSPLPLGEGLGVRSDTWHEVFKKAVWIFLPDSLLINVKNDSRLASS